jgi:hypothetical protein
MSLNASRFPAQAPQRDDPGVSPLLGATIHWLGRGGVRSTQAVLLAVEAGEALVLADARPRRGARVALRLGWPAPPGWATATVVRSRRTRLGPWEVRLRLEGRPTATFRMMIGAGSPERH